MPEEPKDFLTRLGEVEGGLAALALYVVTSTKILGAASERPQALREALNQLSPNFALRGLREVEDEMSQAQKEGFLEALRMIDTAIQEIDKVIDSSGNSDNS